MVAVTGNRKLVGRADVPEGELRADADEPEPASATDSTAGADVLDFELGCEGRDVLDALADDGCRAILEAATDSEVSVPELSEECGLPLSTAYRKIDTLTRLGLIEGRTCIHRSGGKVNKYTCIAGQIRVNLDGAGEMSLRVSRRSSPPDTAVADDTSGD